jgi:hypothetical protein
VRASCRDGPGTTVADADGAAGPDCPGTAVVRRTGSAPARAIDALLAVLAYCRPGRGGSLTSAAAGELTGAVALPATAAGTIGVDGPNPLASPARAPGAPMPAAASSRVAAGVRAMLIISGIETAASRRTAGTPDAGTAQSSAQARLCWWAGVPPTVELRRTGCSTPVEREADAAAGAGAGPAGVAAVTDTAAGEFAAPGATGRAGVRAAPPVGCGFARSVVGGFVLLADAAVARRATGAPLVRAATGAAPAAGSAGSTGARLTPTAESRWIASAGRISPSARVPRWPWPKRRTLARPTPRA